MCSIAIAAAQPRLVEAVNTKVEMASSAAGFSEVNSNSDAKSSPMPFMVRLMSSAYCASYTTFQASPEHVASDDALKLTTGVGLTVTSKAVLPAHPYSEMASISMVCAVALPAAPSRAKVAALPVAAAAPSIVHATLDASVPVYSITVSKGAHPTVSPAQAALTSGKTVTVLVTVSTQPSACVAVRVKVYSVGSSAPAYV